MPLKKNIKAGKIRIYFFLSILLIFFLFSSKLISNDDLEGNYTSIKILDKISSKNKLIKLTNNKNMKYKDLIIKSIKCKKGQEKW